MFVTLTYSPDFAAELLKTCKREVVKCGDPQKILACIDV